MEKFLHLNEQGRRRREKKARKYKPDDIRKKIKVKFHKTLKLIMNNNLKKLIQNQSVSDEIILNTLCTCIELNPFDYDYYSTIYRLAPFKEVRRNLLFIVNCNGTNAVLEKRFDDIEFADHVKMLKTYTTDEYVLKNHNAIAVNQDELSEILTNHRETKNHEVF